MNTQTQLRHKPCYHTHKPLSIKAALPSIHGGSCINPAVTYADIYIGFDAGMKRQPNDLPWSTRHQYVYLPIPNNCAPPDVELFKGLVEWSADRMRANANIHAGCIGGHGRTGMFFAALVTHMTGNLDSIQYVRDNYCKKAVETQSQIDFLVTHYGIIPAPPRHILIPNAIPQRDAFKWIA